MRHNINIAPYFDHRTGTYTWVQTLIYPWTSWLMDSEKGASLCWRYWVIYPESDYSSVSFQEVPGWAPRFIWLLLYNLGWQSSGLDVTSGTWTYFEVCSNLHRLDGVDPLVTDPACADLTNFNWTISGLDFGWTHRCMYLLHPIKNRPCPCIDV